MMKSKIVRWGICAATLVALVGCAGGGAKGPTDEEMIKAIVDDAMASLVAKDIDKMVVNYADDFKSDQGGGKAEIIEFLKGAKDQGFLDDIKIDTSALTIKIEGEKAAVEPIKLEGAFGAITLSFEFMKKDGAWKISYQAQQ